MNCKCGSKTRVLETRIEMRRRECISCGERFWTQEIKSDHGPTYIPRSKRDKILWHNPFSMGAS